MIKHIYVKQNTRVLAVELEVSDEKFDIERAIKDAAIEHCLKTGVYYWQHGMNYYDFFLNACEENCKQNGFIVKEIRILQDIVEAEKVIVSKEELIVHDAWENEKKSRKWDILTASMELSKMCGMVQDLHIVKEFTLLEWAAEFVDKKSVDLKCFFQEKIREFQSANQGGV